MNDGNMQRKAGYKSPSLTTAVYLSVGISLLFNLIFLLAFFFGEGLLFPHHSVDFQRPPFSLVRFLWNIVQVFMLSFAVYAYDYYISKRRFKCERKRLAVLVLGAVVITFVMSILFMLPMLFHAPQERVLYHIIRNRLIRDYFIMAIALFSWQLLIMKNQQQAALLENEALVNENMRTRFEVLKNQMNPHFLFNSLNTLQVLIGTDDEKAKDYVRQLSQVLRHSLQNKEVVTLSEELGFMWAYCNLMKVRYGDNLNFDVDIDDRYSDFLIMPLSLQMLIENCIKHNVISNRQPLTISIFTDNDNHITVSNNIQPRIDREEGNGIGLFNLAERYRLMWDLDIDIKDSGQKFEITLTLVKP